MRLLPNKPLFVRHLGFLLLFLMMVLSQGCRVGEDDPLISLRSRDARLKGTWRLLQMETEMKLNQFTQGESPAEIILSATYDGRDIRVVTSLNGAVQNDTTIGFAFIMELLDRGKLNYTSTVIVQGAGVRSGGEDNWFWLHDDRRKSRVYLGNALQFTQLLGETTFRQPFFTELEVTELRKDLLRLSLRKRIEQTGLDGNFQEYQVTGRFEFRPN
jgi:hypothetical protein